MRRQPAFAENFRRRMHPRRTLGRRSPILLLPILSLGCFEEGPLSPELDASVGELDASTPVEGDAGQAPTTCDVARPCADGTVCGPEGWCAPRCDAQAGCWIATTPERISELVADGDTLYFVTLASQDPLGNPVGDGKIWRLAAEGNAELLRGDLVMRIGEPVSLTSAGDHLLWHAAGKLRRAAKSSPSVVEPLYATGCGIALPLPDGKLAVQAPGGLFLGSIDGTAPLVKVSSAVDFDPQTDDTQLAQCLALHYADQTVFRARPRPPTQAVGAHAQAIVGFDLRTGIETEQLGAALGEVIAVRPPYFYEVAHSAHLDVQRGNFDGDFQNTARIVNLEDVYAPHAQIHGEWIYVAAPHAPPSNVVTLVRNSLAPPIQIQPLAPEGSFRVPNDSYIATMTVSDDAMFVVVATERGSWIYRQPLPAN